MPKVHHVKRARKAIPSIDVKVGDSYYWWKHRMKGSRSGFKKVSKTRPTRSQLTMSDYLGQLYSLQDDDRPRPSFEDLGEYRDSIRDAIQDLADQQQEKLDNMPEGLQQGDTGQMIQERIDSCENAVGDLDSIDILDEDDFDEEDDDEDIDTWKDNEIDRVVNECQEALDSIE